MHSYVHMYIKRSSAIDISASLVICPVWKLWCLACSSLGPDFVSEACWTLNYYYYCVRSKRHPRYYGAQVDVQRMGGSSQCHNRVSGFKPQLTGEKSTTKKGNRKRSIKSTPSTDRTWTGTDPLTQAEGGIREEPIFSRPLVEFNPCLY